MIRRPPRSTRVRSSAASDVYKRQVHARTLADRLQTLEDLQVASHVVRGASVRGASGGSASGGSAANLDGLRGAGGGGHRRPFDATEGRPRPTVELPRRLSLTSDDQPAGTRHTGS